MSRLTFLGLLPFPFLLRPAPAPAPEQARLFPIADVDYRVTDVWITPGWGWGSGATVPMPRGYIMYTPIFCSTPMQFDAIGVQVVVPDAGSVRLGIYEGVLEPAQNRLSVGNLVVDAGAISVATAGSKMAPIARTLQGWYFLAAVFDCAPHVQVPDGSAAVHSPVQWANNDLNGTFDHCIPISGGQAALVAGGLPAAPVAATATATVARAPVRLRMV